MNEKEIREWLNKYGFSFEKEEHCLFGYEGTVIYYLTLQGLGSILSFNEEVSNDFYKIAGNDFEITGHGINNLKQDIMFFAKNEIVDLRNKKSINLERRKNCILIVTPKQYECLFARYSLNSELKEKNIVLRIFEPGEEIKGLGHPRTINPVRLGYHLDPNLFTYTKCLTIKEQALGINYLTSEPLFQMPMETLKELLWACQVVSRNKEKLFDFSQDSCLPFETKMLAVTNFKKIATNYEEIDYKVKERNREYEKRKRDGNE